MLKQDQLKHVWQAVKQDRKRRQIAADMKIPVKDVDRLYELARQKWGTGPRVVITNKLKQCDSNESIWFERPKAEYSNKSFWNE